MLANYGAIGLFLIVAIIFATTTVLLPPVLRLLGIVPSKPSPLKESVYECGMQTIGKTWVQFNFRYYYYALVFVAIDILVVFIYPWAANFRALGAASFGVILVFIALIGVAYLYAWKKKVLEWK